MMCYHFFLPEHQLAVTLFTNFVYVATGSVLALAHTQFIQTPENLWEFTCIFLYGLMIISYINCSKLL
jgi:hypothetical protein